MSAIILDTQRAMYPTGIRIRVIALWELFGAKCEIVQISRDYWDNFAIFQIDDNYYVNEIQLGIAIHWTSVFTYYSSFKSLLRKVENQSPEKKCEQI